MFRLYLLQYLLLTFIQPWAIGGALILVGSLMAGSLTRLNFNRVSHAVSGFLTVMVMPLTYSIAYGLIAGIGSFIVMEGVFKLLSLVGLELPVESEEVGQPMSGDSLGEKKDGSIKEVEVGSSPVKEGQEAEAPEEAPVEGDEEAAAAEIKA